MIFLAMHFPISGTDISPIYLVIVGFLIGVLGGFFRSRWQLHRGTGAARDWNALEFRRRHRPGAYRGQIGRRG
jgi:hypothetical protein